MELQSERLLIRSFICSDQDDFVAHRLNQTLSQYIVLGQTKAQVLSRFSQIMAGWNGAEGDKLALAIEYREDHNYAGDLMFRYLDIEAKVAEIGYSLKADYHKRGIALEASKLLLNYVFSQLSVNTVMAYCDTRNIASYRLMEKLGMQRKELLPNSAKIGEQWCDSYSYAIDKITWQRLQSCSDG